MISSFIKRLEAQGWKQREIEDKTGITRAYISRLSNGANCSLETLLKFAEAFNVSTDTVLGRANDKVLSPVEEKLLQVTDGNEQIARAALRSAEGEKSLITMERERGKGKERGSVAA
jgi:transcriptional regulator with XRE-family HTH domain